jgi:hypothetical protein
MLHHGRCTFSCDHGEAQGSGCSHVVHECGFRYVFVTLIWYERKYLSKPQAHEELNLSSGIPEPTDLSSQFGKHQAAAG